MCSLLSRSVLFLYVGCIVITVASRYVLYVNPLIIYHAMQICFKNIYLKCLKFLWFLALILIALFCYEGPRIFPFVEHPLDEDAMLKVAFKINNVC